MIKKNRSFISKENIMIMIFVKSMKNTIWFFFENIIMMIFKKLIMVISLKIIIFS